MIKNLFNKKRAIVLIILILGTICLFSGCSIDWENGAVQADKNENRIETVNNVTLDKNSDVIGFDVLAYIKDSRKDEIQRILVDKNTKVMYVYISSTWRRDSGKTITPLLNKDGKPLVYNPKEHYNF